ncbi:MAG: GGDEF domain-containing protein, partial [Oscillospiraceae bacterium]
KKLAYRDGLTGVYNRVAFNEEVEKIKQSYKTNDKIICVCVDINNLKVVNDKDGHHTGDILIKNTAECLDVHLNKYGKVFRTGGDEFIVFLYNICEDTFLKEIDRMIKHLQVFNLDTNVKVNFALGYEILKNNNVEECIKIADQKMYNMKNEIRCARST